MVVEAMMWHHCGHCRSHSHCVCFAKRTSSLYINQVSGHCKWVFKMTSKIVFFVCFFHLKNCLKCVWLCLKWSFWDFIAVCARADSACNARPHEPLQTMALLCLHLSTRMIHHKLDKGPLPGPPPLLLPQEGPQSWFTAASLSS